MVIIIGAANQNTGKALCEAVAAATATRTLLCRSGEKLREAIGENPEAVIFLETGFGGKGITLAKQLLTTERCCNVILVADSDGYALEAIRLRASGYLVKPVTPEAVREELVNLRYPVLQHSTEIYAKTFGNFDIFVGETAMTFRRAKSKELLAYLIDRHGAGVTRKEIAALLFEDRSYNRATQDYVNQIIREMVQALERAGASRMLVRTRNHLAVEPNQFVCELYSFERGEAWAVKRFFGEYMVQYSWAETTEGFLTERAAK